MQAFNVIIFSDLKSFLFTRGSYIIKSKVFILGSG